MDRAYKGAERVRRPQNLARSFETYLQSQTALRILSFDDVLRFLVGCRYVRDRELFGKEEVWQHPNDFERARAGDCEDHALWAWAQLAQLRIEARFTAGFRKGGHAWVTLYRTDPPGIFETTSKEPERAVKDPREDASYEPIWSVDARLRFWWHRRPKKRAGGGEGIEFLERPGGGGL